MSATAPLTLALTQLETTERELVSQEAAAVKHLSSLQLQLAATREAIAGMRKVTGFPAPGRPPAAPRPRDTPASSPTTGSRLQSGKHGQAAAANRERAVLLLIAAGTVATAAIRAGVSTPAGATPHQHRQSIQNALSRMKVKGLIAGAGEGWALTAKGRKAAIAAKEEP